MRKTLADAAAKDLIAAVLPPLTNLGVDCSYDPQEKKDQEQAKEVKDLNLETAEESVA